MADNPITRKEKYLAKLTGSYTGNIQDPITRVEKYLYDLCQKRSVRMKSVRVGMMDFF